MDTTTATTYDDALREFLTTRATFGGGLSNHGPMASEALDHMGVGHWIGPFVDDYRPRLEVRDRTLRTSDWRTEVAAALPGLVGAAAVGAGHCLLRVAHAVRGAARAEVAGEVPEVRVNEVLAALSIWRAAGSDLQAPAQLTGGLTAVEWAAALSELATFDPKPGLLTGTLRLAADQPGFLETVASLAPGSSPTATLDQLALLSVEGFLANSDGLSRFTLLHGVTVSTMAVHLLDHLDAATQAKLVAAVAGFVGAAIVGFDRRSAASPAPVPAAASDQAERAGATLEDHTIKFTDACLALAERTGSDRPLRAAEQRILETT